HTVMTAYTHRYHVIVEIFKLTEANNLARAWDPDTDGGRTFGAARLSPTGQEPATHTACSTVATDAMRAQILQAWDNVPWVRLYDGEVWSWEQALADAGLAVIVEGVGDGTWDESNQAALGYLAANRMAWESEP